jgi:hypothetical protein
LGRSAARSGNPDLFGSLNIPRSTALQWIREGVKEVVTHPSLDKSCDALVEESFALQKTCAAEKARNELVRVSLRIVGFQMQYVRVAVSKHITQYTEGRMVRKGLGPFLAALDVKKFKWKPFCGGIYYTKIAPSFGSFGATRSIWATSIKAHNSFDILAAFERPCIVGVPFSHFAAKFFDVFISMRTHPRCDFFVHF